MHHTPASNSRCQHTQPITTRVEEANDHHIHHNTPATTLRAVAINLTKAILGLGVTALPHAFGILGILPAMACLAVTGVLTYISCSGLAQYVSVDVYTVAGVLHHHAYHHLCILKWQAFVYGMQHMYMLFQNNPSPDTGHPSPAASSIIHPSLHINLAESVPCPCKLRS